MITKRKEELQMPTQPQIQPSTNLFTDCSDKELSNIILDVLITQDKPTTLPSKKILPFMRQLHKEYGILRFKECEFVTTKMLYEENKKRYQK